MHSILKTFLTANTKLKCNFNLAKIVNNYDTHLKLVRGIWYR